ncbi:hypothetical protein CQW23_12192 [Capsicum baccatum]|uniref:Uncharacterized protein n=1 Tax=Capsicum baccatum TaxID=33114 RepID=A0A2G2WRX0_CAPBA|nr:hypothetical protein CQW23_12192 [Capsicum baccatum]
MRSINVAFKGHKSRLKNCHFYAYTNDEIRRAKRPTSIPEPVFENLLKHWHSEEAEEKMKKNKGALSNKEFFVVTRRRKPDRAYKDTSEEITSKIVEMERVDTQESEDGTQSIDAFTTVMGPDHPGRKRLDKLEERMQQIMNAQRDVIECEVTMNIIAQLQRLNPGLTLDRNMLGFNVHSSGEALANQPINRSSVSSNNQGYLPIVLSIDIAPVPATLQLDSIPSLPSILFNSHLNFVPVEPEKWTHLSFFTLMTSDGKIFARAQDDKCIGMQYFEAIKAIQNFDPDFVPLRNVHIVYVPDEEVGGFDGMSKFVELKEFEELNIGKPWHMVIKAVGTPEHRSKLERLDMVLYDNTVMENLMKSIEVITKFRESKFDIVKAGLATNSEAYSFHDLVQHSWGVSKDSSWKVNDKEKHLGFTRYLNNDLLRKDSVTMSDEMETKLQPTHHGNDVDEKYPFPWMGIVANLPIEWKDGGYVGKSGSGLRDSVNVCIDVVVIENMKIGYEETHIKKNKDSTRGDWVEPRARIAYKTQPTSEDGTMVQPSPAELNNMWTTVLGGLKNGRTYGTGDLQSSSSPSLFSSFSSTLQTMEDMEAMKKKIMELTQKCAANDARFAKFNKLEELVKKHMPQVFRDEEDNESDDN